MSENKNGDKKISIDSKLQTIHYNSYQEFYESIPEEGSLGILALGAQGIISWRRKREELKAEREKKATAGKDTENIEKKK